MRKAKVTLLLKYLAANLSVLSNILAIQQAHHKRHNPSEPLAVYCDELLIRFWARSESTVDVDIIASR